VNGDGSRSNDFFTCFLRSCVSHRTMGRLLWGHNTFSGDRRQGVKAEGSPLLQSESCSAKRAGENQLRLKLEPKQCKLTCNLVWFLHWKANPEKRTRQNMDTQDAKFQDTQPESGRNRHETYRVIFALQGKP